MVVRNLTAMYYKIINERQVFSACNTIQTSEGLWISNPTEEQIAAAGWLPYVPPEVIPEPATEPDYDDVLAAVKRMLASSAEGLTDEEALQVAALYPTWASRLGEQVAAGERLWYDGKLYRVVQQHTAQDDWTPDKTPALFTEVSIEEWPDFVQPTGAQDAYNKGDKVTYEGRHYVSISDGNVWAPDAFPAGWEAQ